MSSCVATPVLALLHRQREQSTQEQRPWGSAPSLGRDPVTLGTAHKGGQPGKAQGGIWMWIQPQQILTSVSHLEAAGCWLLLTLCCPWWGSAPCAASCCSRDTGRSHCFVSPDESRGVCTALCGWCQVIPLPAGKTATAITLLKEEEVFYFIPFYKHKLHKGTEIFVSALKPVWSLAKIYIAKEKTILYCFV